MTTIRVLVEERALAPGLKTEHGLSLFFETGGKSWLVDTGQSDAAALNSRRMGIDPSLIEGIVISHGHYDHTGGLLAALAVSGPKTIYAHPGIFRRRFNLKKNRPDRSIGFPHKKSAVMARGGSFDFNRSWRRVADHIFLSGEIPLVADFEKGE